VSVRPWIDAFNLNATYLRMLAYLMFWGVFSNKLSETGFYSLENCKTQVVTAYFDQNEEKIQKQQVPFGFLPIFPTITTRHAMNHVEEYIQSFATHCDVLAILRAAKRIKENQSPLPLPHRQVKL